MGNKVCKIFAEDEWKRFQETGQFSGSAEDIRDGFIHLCTEEQIAGVIERFFFGRHPLYIVEFSDPEFLGRLTWEASASGIVFPHLYCSDVYLTEVRSYFKLTENPDIRFK